MVESSLGRRRWLATGSLSSTRSLKATWAVCVLPRQLIGREAVNNIPLVGSKVVDVVQSNRFVK